jgi:hypothetical protein
MSSLRAEILRRSSRWATAAVVLALTPKCMLCLAAYVGLGTALGLSAPELCGAPADSPSSWAWILVVLGIALGILGLLARGRWHARGR